MKKLIALLLALVMVIGLIACGNTKPEETKAPAADETKAPAADETKAPEPKEPVTIRYFYNNGVGEQQYTTDVEEKLNEMLSVMPGYEHISIDLVPTASHAQEVSLAQANGEQIDIVSTFGLAFDAMVADGDFIALEDLIEAYPDVISEIPEWMLDYGKIDGTVYYIITPQQVMIPTFFYAPVEYFEYYYAASGDTKEDVVKILQDGSLEEVYDFYEEFYKAVVEGTGLKTKKMGAVDYAYARFNADEIDGAYNHLLYIEDSEEPVWWTTTPEFKYIAGRLNEWYKNGWHWNADEKGVYDFAQDNSVVFHLGQGAYSEEAYATVRSTEDIPVDAIRMTKTNFVPSRYAVGGNAIYADCEHPEEAMMIIELLMTDKGDEFYNTLVWGLEGIHYEWVDKDARRIKTLEYNEAQGGATASHHAYWWNTGNSFNAWQNQGTTDGHYEYIENELHNGPNTVLSPYMGITWHLEDYADQISQIKAVDAEFFGNLHRSADFEATWAEYQAKLEAAGVKEVMAGVCEQAKTFLDNK